MCLGKLQTIKAKNTMCADVNHPLHVRCDIKVNLGNAFWEKPN